MAAQGLGFFFFAPHVTLIPSVMIFLLVLSMNILSLSPNSSIWRFGALPSAMTAQRAGFWRLIEACFRLFLQFYSAFSVRRTDSRCSFRRL